MYDQVWESIINQTECELLQGDKAGEPTGTILDRHAIAPQLMGAHDIALFIEVTAQSHRCDPKDISYYYEPIIGDDGCVLLDELFLVFNMKSLKDGVLLDRQIHTIRVVVPQEVQQRARAMIEGAKSVKVDAVRSAFCSLPECSLGERTQRRTLPGALPFGVEGAEPLQGHCANAIPQPSLQDHPKPATATPLSSPACTELITPRELCARTSSGVPQVFEEQPSVVVAIPTETEVKPKKRRSRATIKAVPATTAAGTETPIVRKAPVRKSK